MFITTQGFKNLIKEMYKAKNCISQMMGKDIR